MNIFPPKAGTIARAATVGPIFEVVVDRDLHNGDRESQHMLIGGKAINSSRMADIAKAFGDGDVASIREMRMLRAQEEKVNRHLAMAAIEGTTLVVHKIVPVSRIGQQSPNPAADMRLAG